jgi:hypothetical protein
MRVYVLHFASPGLMTLAFDRIIASDRVASCMVEPNEVRLRFLAPARVADALVQRVYLEGGLTWCSRHDLREQPAVEPVPIRPVA